VEECALNQARGARDGFDVSARRRGDADVVTARGELDLVAAPQLRSVLADPSVCGAPHLVVDLRAVSFIDSTAISTLVAGRRLAASRGGRTVLVTDPRSAVQRVMQVLRMQQVMEIVDSVEIALKSLDIVETDQHDEAQDEV
jgi:anti-anti-sigma factor